MTAAAYPLGATTERPRANKHVLLYGGRQGGEGIATVEGILAPGVDI